MNLDQANRIYLIGIKGVGMAALAQLLKHAGKTVWGSDTAEPFLTDEVLRREGIECTTGWSAQHLDRPVDLVIRSTAWGETNEEVAAALQRGLPVFTYPEALGQLVAGRQAIAVVGSHGKTTTTALLAYVLQACGKFPSALVGSRVPQWQGSALTGSGELFVFEADEYQNKLQHYHPQGVVLTSVDWDHPDFFPTAAAYEATFVEFLKKVPRDGFVVACYDDARVKQVVEAASIVPGQLATYGLKQGNLRLVRMWLDEGHWHFSVKDGEEFLGEFWLELVGGHNVQNAIGVITVARRLGLDLEKVRSAICSFDGTARRFEAKGKLLNAVTVFDDYAHHPSEISATLKAARVTFPYKVIRVAFMPHTFSRTAAFLQGFGTAFVEADEVVVLETYGSAREAAGAVGSTELVAELTRNKVKAKFLATNEEAAQYLGDTATRGDLVITMGAGDVWQVADLLTKRFGLMTGQEF